MELKNGPLTGVRVLDLSLLLPGPLCSQHLADMGAEVIKVENPRMGDGTRYMGTKMTEGEFSETGLYLQLNRNKKSITVNIKREAGRDVILRLLKDCDILLEGFRPDTLSDLGIGYEQLKEKFPKLIYCAISGYGATGHYKEHAGHDANYIARAGLLALNGNRGQAPVVPGFQVADIAGGTLTALSAILAALYAREKTGRGQFLDVSMQDGATPFLSLFMGEYVASGKEPERGNEALSGLLPNYQIYETKDHKYVMLAALEEKFFQTFLRQIEREDLLKNMPKTTAGFTSVTEELRKIFMTRSYDEWSPLFENPDSCFSGLSSMGDVLKDKHLRERGTIIEIDHPQLGKIPVIGSPFHFSDTPVSYRYAPPKQGEHTGQVLADAGYSEAEIDALRDARCV